MSNHCLFLPSGFPRVPLNAGIGRTIGQLKRITIKFCKSRGSSKGVRSFIEQDLLDFTKQHPDVVIYLKPRRHHSPVVISEYLNGERHYMNFYQFTREEIMLWMNFFTTRIGVQNIRYRKLWYTACPSIQGIWSPFTNRDPAMNVETFPNPKFNVPANMGYSATERLKQLYERQKEKEEREKTFGLENLKIEVQK